MQNTVFRKIKIASDRIDEMKRFKDQKLSILNLSTFRTILKKIIELFTVFQGQTNFIIELALRGGYAAPQTVASVFFLA